MKNGLMRKKRTLLLLTLAAVICGAAAAALFLLYTAVGWGLIFVLVFSTLVVATAVLFALFLFYVRPVEFAVKKLEQISGVPFSLRKTPEQLFDSAANLFLKKDESSLLTVQAEVFALQNQINPHFLYNTLDVIRSFALNDEPEKVSEIVEALAQLFRYSINRPGVTVTLDDEIENTKNYLTIQQYRFGDKFDVVWEIDDDCLEIMNQTLPNLILQPIVENAIHHGIEKTTRHGVLRIHIFCTQNKLVVCISDNGAGMDADTLQALTERLKLSGVYADRNDVQQRYHGGVALDNVNKRLVLCYGEEYGLTMVSTADVGTSVTICIPLMQEYL